MGKSSSSFKKKRSRDSSQARKRKKSKVKSRKTKSKVAHRREESVSYSSGDDSTRSASEDCYRSRKRSRSRTRKDLKSSKRKREKRQDSSSESIDDSPRKRKLKKSKKNKEIEVRKKDYVKKKKKKAERDYSVSSGSCSTCRGSDDSDGESEHERLEARGRLKRKGKDRKTKKQYRSWSLSSCSQYSESREYPVEEKVTVEMTTRLTTRPRSVITIPDRVMEGSGLYDAGHKDEMVYDRDDYLSCRSNDSNDGESKRDFSPPLNCILASSKEEPISNDKGEVCLSDIQSTKIEEIGDEMKSEVSASVSTPNSDDLELILRQKALENLRKFRGGLPRNVKAPSVQKDAIDSSVQQQPSASRSILRQHTLPKVERISISTSENESNFLSQDDGKVLDRNESASIKEGIVCPPTEVPVMGNAKKNINISSISNKPTLASPLLKRALSNIHTSTPPNRFTHAKLATQDSADKRTAENMPPPNENSGDAKNDSTSVSISNKPNLASPIIKRALSNIHTSTKPVPSSIRPTHAKLVTQDSLNKRTAETVPPPNGNSGDAMNASASVSISNKPNMASPLIKRSLSNIHTSTKPVPSPIRPPHSKLVTQDSLNKQTAETVPSPNSGDAKNASASVSVEQSSCPKPTSGEATSDKIQAEAKEGLQFEEKKMTMKRGGEMVEVSYKVYIPKKTPALHRRQLNR